MSKLGFSSVVAIKYGAQAHMLADLVYDCAPSGPFAGQLRRRGAAPLVAAMFREGEHTREAEYAKYLGIGLGAEAGGGRATPLPPVGGVSERVGE